MVQKERGNEAIDIRNRCTWRMHKNLHHTNKDRKVCESKREQPVVVVKGNFYSLHCHVHNSHHSVMSGTMVNMAAFFPSFEPQVQHNNNNKKRTNTITAYYSNCDRNVDSFLNPRQTKPIDRIWLTRLDVEKRSLSITLNRCPRQSPFVCVCVRVFSRRHNSGIKINRKIQ